jgi:uncharacterized Fe-S cluster-containing radical SAM superfamily protein
VGDGDLEDRLGDVYSVGGMVVADELGCHADCTAGCRPRRTRRASLDARG